MRSLNHFPRVRLIRGETPVHPLHGLGSLLGHGDLYVKREDMTDDTYGGNKVRNLEFILGEALARGAKRLVTVAPLGSNFIAALSAQAATVSLPVEVLHFVPTRTPQIEAHARFARGQGASMRVFPGRWGALPAAALASLACMRRGSYWISPGGSSPTGVLGPLSAAMELAAQVARGEAPQPDAILVGVGTCGTMAGLLAGIALSGLPTRVIGIRCVDRLVCRRGKVARLANAALALLGERIRIDARDVDLRDRFNGAGYGNATAAGLEAMEAMHEEEGIALDTTYTSKVVSSLFRWVRNGELAGRTVWYWHTYSGLPCPPMDRVGVAVQRRRPAMQRSAPAR